ncbi:MAG: 30S ribosomal protein S17e [Candidatus Aenigmatarchaeota archaeon]
MGCIRTSDIKNLAVDLVEAYPDRFNEDFDNNKTVINELKTVESRTKKFRNKVAGYVVRAYLKKKNRYQGPIPEAVEEE